MTHESVAAHFYCELLRQDVAVLVSTSLHIFATIGGRRLPRQMARAIHAEKWKEVILFDVFIHGGEPSMHSVNHAYHGQCIVICAFIRGI